MTRHPVNNNTHMGLVTSLRSNSNHWSVNTPETASSIRHLLSCGTIHVIHLEPTVKSWPSQMFISFSFTWSSLSIYMEIKLSKYLHEYLHQVIKNRSLQVFQHHLWSPSLSICLSFRSRIWATDHANLQDKNLIYKRMQQVTGWLLTRQRPTQ